MMPNWFPSWTNCSTPQSYYGVPVWALVLIGGSGLVALIVAGVAGAWAPGVAAFLATACLAGITLCTWWLNVRLVCLGGDRSAVGAIHNLEPPTPSLNAFAFGDYDTDYSFNLLLWPFWIGDYLPSSFVGNDASGQFNAQEWDPVSVDQLWSNDTYWNAALGGPGPPGGSGSPYQTTTYPWEPIQPVKDQVNLILPQQSMASLKLSFTGQASSDVKNFHLQPIGDSNQQFLLHCEIEGRGMYDFRTFLWVLFGVFTAAAALSLIPVIGSVLAWILSVLALLALLFGGPALQYNDQASPPGGDWGGSFNAFTSTSNPDSPVDLAYVYGRWVYDSLHSGWNELHPLHYMIKIGSTTQGALVVGAMPNLGDTQAKLDTIYQTINNPSTQATQAEPQNQWSLHPLLDGCTAGEGYPEPPPPQTTQ